MRRLCMSIVILGSLLAAAIPAQANASIDSHFKARGSSASAYFTTLPSSGARPDTVYTDTFVFAAHDATFADGSRYQDDVAYVFQDSYKISDGAGFVPVASAHGFAHGDDVSFATTGKLTAATLSASVPLTRCEPSTQWWPTCSDAAVTALNVDWAGDGALSRGVSITNWGSGNSRYVSRYNGSYRAASATGTLGSNDLGASSFGSLADSSSMSLSICHGC
jgi:hypothetical protein